MSLLRRNSYSTSPLAIAVCIALVGLVVLHLAGCTAVADWLSAPAFPADPGSSPAASPTESPTTPESPTHGDVVLDAGVSFLGSINPFLGYGALALGRLGLVWLAHARSKN